MAVFELTRKELKEKSPFDYNSGDTIYVRPNEKSDYKYAIELKKEKYPTFSLETRVRCAETFKYISSTVGSKKGMRPIYIDDFIRKREVA
jgi:hypothetical protein